MRSIKNEQFNQPLAENQEEYNTLHINLNTEDPLCPATVFFQFSPEELAVLNANEGKFYYQQCLFRTTGVNDKGEIVKVPANQFHPMSIHVHNPLELHIEHIPVPLKQLTEMSGDHFSQIFQVAGFAPSFVKEIISRFSSLHGFHDAIGKYGYFDSHRKAVELGYDVEFTLARS